MDGNLASITLSVARGEDKTFTGTHQTSATNTAGVNITGWTMVFTTRTIDGRPLFSKAISLLVAGSGTYQFTLSASDTTITPGNYPCDIWRTDSGSATILAQGFLTVNAEIRV